MSKFGFKESRAVNQRSLLSSRPRDLLSRMYADIFRSPMELHPPATRDDDDDDDDNDQKLEYGSGNH